MAKKNLTKAKKTKVKKSGEHMNMFFMEIGSDLHVDGAAGGHGVITIRCRPDALEVIARRDAGVLFLRQE